MGYNCDLYDIILIGDEKMIVINGKKFNNVLKRVSFSEYNVTQDEELKKKILANKLFNNYKEKETDLNILILELNRKLKEISDKGKCNL